MLTSSAMEIKFAPQIFHHWLQANYYRFKHPPRIIKICQDDLFFQFNGVTPMIQGYLNESGNFEIGVYFRGECWDIVAEFDVYPSRNSQGQYYCRECKRSYEQCLSREHPAFYSSIQKLWIEHSFEPFLRWANKNLQSCCRLCLGSGEGIGTWAAIKIHENIKADEWPLIFPVIM
jgi:hypothetical protein